MNDTWHVQSDDDPNEIVEIQPVVVVISPDTAKELIIAGIRDDLGLRFDGDQLFEGCINPQELADAILERLQNGGSVLNGGMT
jgi:hypothetical protein